MINANAQAHRWISEAASGDADLEADLTLRWGKGEPLQYVLGSWGFRKLDLLVDRRVLIPRPETEVVAGLAIAEARKLSEPTVVDLGTGSGAIALAIATELPNSNVIGTDSSEDALSVARQNDVSALVEWRSGTWFAALPDELLGAVDVLVSNPPYVAEDEDLPDVVKQWEPTSALVAGPTGTECLELILQEAGKWLRPSAAIVLEMAPHQTEVMADLAAELGFIDVKVHPDMAGKPRALVAHAPTR